WARAVAFVEPNLSCRVCDASGRSRSRRGLRIDGFTRAIYVSEAAIVRTLHIDVERSHVVVAQIHSRSINRILPLSVIYGNQWGGYVRRSEEVVAAVTRVCRRNSGSGSQACDCHIGNIGY